MNDEGQSQHPDLPSGTATFLFTDIEGSTRLERELRERYSDVLREHAHLLRSAFREHGGHEIDTQGDSFFAVFARARDAVAAAVAIQRGLSSQEWPDGHRVRVRIGMHTGEASLSDGRYIGLAVHRAARISAAGHGGQILLSSSTRDVVEDDLPHDQRLIALGEHQLKDLPRPERVYQLVAEGLAHDFPPLKTAAEQQLAEAAAAVLAPPWWRRRTSIILPLAAIVAVALVVGAAIALTGSDAGAAGVRANAVGLIDAGGDSVDGEIPVDAAPTSIAVGERAVWVTNANAASVSRIDPETRTVRQTIGVGNSPSGIAVGAGDVWVANYGDGTVSRIDSETQNVVDTIVVGNGPAAVAFGAGSVWVTNSSDRTLSQIDAVSGDVVRTIRTDATGRGIAFGAGSVWVTDESTRRVVRVDAQTHEIAETISVGNGPIGIAFGEGAVWVANSLDGTVSRIDPETATVTATLNVGGAPGAVAAGAGFVWVSAEFGQRLARIDPDAAAPKIVDDVPIMNRPKGLAVVDDSVWVAVQASGRGHRGGRLVITDTSPPDSIDPQDSAGNTVSLFLWDGLTAFRRVGGSEGSQLLPNLATSIPDARDGGRSYTFRLRPGIRYSDGRLLRPQDFRRALERGLPRGFGEQFSSFKAVTGAEACSRGRRCDLSRGVVTTRHTVTFKLSRPAPLFLFDLPFLHPVPRGVPSNVGTKPVPGTGPYVVDTYVPRRQLKLARNPHFRVWSEAARPGGYVDEVVYSSSKNAAEDVTAVASGRADVVARLLPPDQVERIRVRYPRQLHIDPEQWTHILFLDTTQPPFNDVRVRRALNLAVDRRRLVEMGGGPEFRQPTCQVIPPSVPGYARYCPYTIDPRATGEWTAPDFAEARRLVGASRTTGARITVWTWPDFEAEGRYMVSLMRRLGYRVGLRQVENINEYFRMMFDPRVRMQSGIVGWIGMQYGSHAIELLGCNSPANIARFCDRRIDRENARALNLLATDQEAAARIWARLDRELVDQAPWVPLFNPRIPMFVSKRVGNWQIHPHYGPLLDQLWVR